MRIGLHLALSAAFCAASVGGAEWRWTLRNPTGREYRDEALRLKVDLPADAKQGDYVVKASGQEVPYQIEEIDGDKAIWVAATLGKDQAIDYVVTKGRPAAFKPMVRFATKGGGVVLNRGIIVFSNGLVGVAVPGVMSQAMAGPIFGVELPGGKAVGKSVWHTGRKLGDFSVTVVGDGTIFAKVRLRYEFEGMAGLWGNVPAFATIDVALYPGQRHVVVEEAHEMGRGDCWELDCAAGWGARQAEAVTHSRMWHPHGGREAKPITTLEPGQTRMGDTLVNLQPRWSQAFDEGWFFACHDGTNAVGALACRAAKWHWPHSNLIEVKVKRSGDYAGLRCPTWKGRRYWFLLVGPKATWDDKAKRDYVKRHGFYPLDKLHQHYALDWPGIGKLAKKPGSFPRVDQYSSWMNPTSMLRGFGRRAMRDAGKQGNVNTLGYAQFLLDPDTYGSYWNYWSPENPNFFTDFIRPGIAMVTQLKKHPRFKELAKAAEQKFREDVYHTITLPGGAGQECPGYVAYAMNHTWSKLAPICRQHLGFDPAKWPRFRAGASFLPHISQPVGGGKRRCHPGGDTHPPGPDVTAFAEKVGIREDVKTFKTEELPGFGVVFRNHPGTERETYLAFKSGPNRGHYHGDQLSVHYCAQARPLAVDHMCSYGPRAGQEHMHNRVAFHTDKLPWANMDGYERVIAFKTSPGVDVAIGQVESERLRVTTEYPPEAWDTYLPEQRFDTPLRYRRTIVMLKCDDGDYFVIRDQHDGPNVKATWCLHVLSETCERKGESITFDGLTVHCVKPREFDFGRHDWKFEKRDRKTKRVTFKEHTKGIRLTIEGERSELITVLMPRPMQRHLRAVVGGVGIGDDEITFGGGIDDQDGTAYVTVKRGGRAVVAVTGKDIDLDRSQGEIGLFVPDAGYPFGVIPDWLIKQRSAVPAWAPAWAREARRHELKQ